MIFKRSTFPDGKKKRGNDSQSVWRAENKEQRTAEVTVSSVIYYYYYCLSSPNILFPCRSLQDNPELSINSNPKAAHSSSLSAYQPSLFFGRYCLTPVTVRLLLLWREWQGSNNNSQKNRLNLEFTPKKHRNLYIERKPFTVQPIKGP